MYGTGLTDELATESFEYRFDANKDAPEPVRGFRVIRVMDYILIESNGVRYFYRHRPDPYIDAHPMEPVQNDSIEFRHRHRFESNHFRFTVRAFNYQLMADEIKNHCER